jgi:hypothetical protein
VVGLLRWMVVMGEELILLLEDVLVVLGLRLGLRLGLGFPDMVTQWCWMASRNVSQS